MTVNPEITSTEPASQDFRTSVKMVKFNHAHYAKKMGKSNEVRTR